MWLMIMAVLALLGLTALIYLTTRFHRFSFIKKLEGKSRLLSWLAALLGAVLPGLFVCINITTAFVAALHLTAAFLLCGLVAFAVRKGAGKEIPFDAQGAAAIGITVIWLSVGWFMAHHVFETDYRVESAKPLARDFRIVCFADSHLGVTLDGGDFAREMRRIRALEPDAVVIVGDFVDDSSDAEDMKTACRALGELGESCGVYFVWGNHDRGYSQSRNFSAEELRAELLKNNVTILKDEAVLLDGGLYLIGRRDRSDRGRADMESLMGGLDRTKFTVVLDHQPNDYAAETAAGADLVLSGHTHGGHIFPAGLIGRLLGANDAVYGMEKRGNTTFIVTSGLSGWAIPFKTGAFSEFAVIDVAAPTE